MHLLRYIYGNKTLSFKYHAYVKYSTLSDLLRQANINTKNHFMYFSDYSCQYLPDTGISTVEYIIFDQGGIYRCYEHKAPNSCNTTIYLSQRFNQWTTGISVQAGDYGSINSQGSTKNTRGTTSFITSWNTRYKK